MVALVAAFFGAEFDSATRPSLAAAAALVCIWRYWVRGTDDTSQEAGKIGPLYSHCWRRSPEELAEMSAAAERLARVLDGKEEIPEDDQDALMMETEAAPPGFCVECKEKAAKVRCDQCTDEYCRICFQMQHRKGKRAGHTTTAVKAGLAHASSGNSETMDVDDDAPLASFAPSAGSAPGNWFTERAKFIPVRLTMKERKQLRLLEAVLSSSEYTSKIDVTGKSKAKRVQAQLQEICAMLTALIVARNFKDGKEIVENKNYKDHEAYIQDVLEVGRRHKIMNPEKMRGEYGKLIYMLQDSVTAEVQNLLDIKIVKPVVTVHSYLAARGAAGVLEDELITTATREIIADGVKSRITLNRESKEKHRAIEYLADKYSARGKITDEEIKLCLYSMGDNHSFLTANRDPVDTMIAYLTTLFDPASPEPDYDLSIAGGEGGARLSHSHEKQYYYVLQSLTLWREIAHDMFRLWYLSEEDLLDLEHRYELKDTGQGFQRVQQAPRISLAMRHVLHHTQQKVGQWIGSSVIHLGDNNVPNALVFIDKYTQVASILNPIVLVLRQISELVKSPPVEKYVDEQFGGVAKLRKDILIDFFRSAFDGSGADNFYDAVGGRTTFSSLALSLVRCHATFRLHGPATVHLAVIETEELTLLGSFVFFFRRDHASMVV